MTSPARPQDSPATRTVAAWNIRYLVRHAARRGMSETASIAHFDLDSAALADVDGRVPLSTYARMWNELPALLDDPDLALHLVAGLADEDPPLNALLFLAAPNLGEGIQRLLRYQRLTLDLADDSASSLLVADGRAEIVVHHERSAVLPPTAAVVDAFLGLITIAQLATATPIAPRSVTLRHPEPADPGPYAAAFGCAPRFGADRDRLVLDAADLERPHPQASATLSFILERYAEAWLERLPDGANLREQVTRALRSRLPDGEIRLDDVARDLDVAPRTLQRRLKDEGTSLRRLLDEERKGLALQKIRDPTIGLVDLALLLGFADQSAFTRAFVRWTGETPTAHRRR
ncbi:MAG: AraC family transcriptional regulator [Polyangiaceae bacterium]